MFKKISVFFLINLMALCLTSCKINIKTNNNDKTENNMPILPPPYIPDITKPTPDDSDEKTEIMTPTPEEDKKTEENETPKTPEKEYQIIKVISGHYKVLLASYITGTTTSNSDGTNGTTKNSYTENETFEIKSKEVNARIVLSNTSSETNDCYGKIEKKDDEMIGETNFKVKKGTGTIILSFDGKSYNGTIVYNAEGKSTYLTKFKGSNQTIVSDYNKTTTGKIIWDDQELNTNFTFTVNHDRETKMLYEFSIEPIIVDDYKVEISKQRYSFLLNELVGHRCFINSDNCFLVQNIQAKD